MEDVSISWLTVLVAYLYRQEEQATITLMHRMIQIVTGNNVNPILLRPVLGIVLNTDSVLLEMEQRSWPQSGLHAAGFPPLIAIPVSVKLSGEMLTEPTHLGQALQ